LRLNKRDGGEAEIVVVERLGDRFEALHPPRQIDRKTIAGEQDRFEAFLRSRPPKKPVSFCSRRGTSFARNAPVSVNDGNTSSSFGPANLKMRNIPRVIINFRLKIRIEHNMNIGVLSRRAFENAPFHLAVPRFRIRKIRINLYIAI
jgi:hypothetical protein